MIHDSTAEGALGSLRSGSLGLTEAEAVRRLHEYGANRVDRTGRNPILLRLLRGFSHSFAVVLWIAAILSFLANRREPGQGMERLGWAIIEVILVSGLFSYFGRNAALSVC